MTQARNVQNEPQKPRHTQPTARATLSPVGALSRTRTSPRSPTATADGASAYLSAAPAPGEDLTQTALIKVALRWPQLRDGQPEAYLRAILYRDAVSWWRRRRREVLVADPPEALPADDGGERAQLRVIFARALARLTPKQRAVLVLRFSRT